MLLAFTLLELVIIIVIVGVFVAGVLAFLVYTVWAKITGTWTTKPATIPIVPGSGTFVFTVSRAVGSGMPVGVPARALEVDLLPAAGTAIIAMTDATGTTTYSPAQHVHTVTASSDEAGAVSVTVQIDFVGQASLTGTDTKSKHSETHVFAGV
jgi:hypothetical protein